MLAYFFVLYGYVVYYLTKYFAVFYNQYLRNPLFKDSVVQLLKYWHAQKQQNHSGLSYEL